MKFALILTTALSSASAFAAEIRQPRHVGLPVNVLAVSAVASDDPFPATSVSVTAEFSNPCMIAEDDELVLTSDSSLNFSVLKLQVLNISERICTREFNPQVVTIRLGAYPGPNDGAFARVVVNGRSTRVRP